MFLRAVTCLVSTLLLAMTCGCHYSAHFGSIPPPPLLGKPTDPDVVTGLQPISASSLDHWDIPTYCLAKSKQIEGDSDDPEDRATARNNAIGWLMIKINESHDVYTGRVSFHRSVFDVSSDLALAGSTAVSAINPGVVIGATSTALVAGKSSVEKNLYNDASRTALLIDMYKSAATKEAVLESRYSASYATYPMLAACKDVDAFFRSVSMIRAVHAAAAAPIASPPPVPANLAEPTVNAGTNPAQGVKP